MLGPTSRGKQDLGIYVRGETESVQEKISNEVNLFSHIHHAAKASTR